MKLGTRLFRGFGAFAAFLCALLLGVYGIASSADYKGMVDGMLGGASAKAGSSESYAFTSEYDSLSAMLTERVRIAEQIGEEGCVLLKNQGGLPLGDGSGEKNVTVLGNRPYTYKADGTLRDTRLTFYGGITGSVIYEQTVTIQDENGNSKTISSPVTLERAFEDAGIHVNPAMRNFYSDKGYSPFPAGSEAADSAGGAYSIEEPSVGIENTGNYEDYDDACFVVIGRTSGEGRDYLPGISGVKSGSTQKSAIGLSDEERNLIAVADQISHGKVIVLLNSAVTMEIDELKNDDRVNSILWIGLPGSYGMNGVARVISGKASPSGHLSDTYAVEASNAPAARNFGDGDPAGTAKFAWSNGTYTSPSNGHYVVMAEGIYTGYYYYETRYNDAVLDAVVAGRTSSNASGKAGASGNADSWVYQDEVVYPFGYGLSYSSFTQKIKPETFLYDENEDTVSIDVEVKNVGDVTAKDVVSLYVQTPYTEYDKAHGVEKSAIQLIAFEKTDALEPDDTQTLTLTADVKYFASYDKTVQHDGVTGGYILDKGDYYFAIGNGAHEALNNILVNCVGIAETDPNIYIEAGSAINADGTYVWDIAAQRTQADNIAAFEFDSLSGIDATHFSESESGVVIQNQLEDADYNYYVKGVIKYLSRSDWNGTFPVSYTGLANNAAMGRHLALNSSVFDFSQSGDVPDYVMFGVDHTEEEDENTGVPLENTDIASYKGKAYDDESWDYLLQQISFDEAWQFAPLGGTKCEMFRTVNAPEVWQIDGPNGNVNRGYSTLAPTAGEMSVSPSDPNAGYRSADMPCAPVIGATYNKELIEEEGEIFGEDTLWSRNPIMWAPGMNLHRTSFNSRNHEYYSEDPMLTNLLGTSFVRGGLKKGAILSAKHFAFNTQESYREGLCQFFEEQSGREMELRAFQGLSEDIAYVDANNNTLNALGLMSTFSRIGVTGANGHTGMMKNILRGEWGFKGLISTDMVSRTGFFNPQDCVLNNVTFMATSSGESFLASGDWASYNNKQLVKSCPAMMTGLYENMHYYMYAIANSSALNGYSPGDTIVEELSWWQTLLIVLTIVFGVIAIGLVAASIVFSLLNKNKNSKDAHDTNVHETTKVCPHCGAINGDVEICAYCGKPFADSGETPSEDDPDKTSDSADDSNGNDAAAEEPVADGQSPQEETGDSAVEQTEPSVAEHTAGESDSAVEQKPEAVEAVTEPEQAAEGAATDKQPVKPKRKTASAKKKSEAVEAVTEPEQTAEGAATDKQPVKPKRKTTNAKKKPEAVEAVTEPEQAAEEAAQDKEPVKPKRKSTKAKQNSEAVNAEVKDE